MQIEREQQTLQAQIKRILREEIAQGVWQSGARIPTESELMHRFSVSRITVSQALKDMVKEGLVVRRQGRGTFVSAHQHAWVNLGGLLQRMPPGMAESRHARTRMVKDAPPADVALDLRLSPGAKTWHFARVKLIGDSPQAWEEAYIPESLVREEPAPGADWGQQFFVAILAHLTGHKARRCRAFLRAVLPEPELALELQEQPGQPAIEVVRLWQGELGNPVMLTRSVLKSGGSRYYVDLTDPERAGEEGQA